MTTAGATFLRSSGLPFLTVARTMSPTPADGRRFRRPLIFVTEMMYRFFAPVLSAQLMTAPTGRPSDTRNLEPEAPPLPRFDIFTELGHKSACARDRGKNCPLQALCKLGHESACERDHGKNFPLRALCSKFKKQSRTSDTGAMGTKGRRRREVVTLADMIHSFIVIPATSHCTRVCGMPTVSSDGANPLVSIGSQRSQSMRRAVCSLQAGKL